MVDSNSGATDKAKFLKDYSKALGEALREKEEASSLKTGNSSKQNTATTTKSEKDALMKNAYKALCFDDPRVESEEACRLLAKALVEQNQQQQTATTTTTKAAKTTKEATLSCCYAPSERFVEGVLQATGRYETKANTATAAKTGQSQKSEDADTAPASTTDQQQQQSLISPDGGGAATAVGYSTIAAALFCQIPLECCQSDNLQEVQTWLGSFRGAQPQKGEETAGLHKTNEKDDDDEVKRVIDEQLKSMQMSNDEAKNETNEPKQQQTAEYEEVWADESDPSDFDFGESGAFQQPFDFSAWDQNTSFDPVELSKPILDDDWPQLQIAVANLLTDLTFTKVAPLSKGGVWNRLDLSSSLTQLTLTLLLESSNPMMEGLRQHAVYPLNVLRDRVLYHQQGLDEYLRLVQSLIGIHAASLSSSSPQSHSKHQELRIASVLGLSSLSSICTDAKALRQVRRIRKTVLEACEDLCAMVETCAAQQKEEWVRLVWALFPLMDLLSNVKSDGVLIETTVTVSPKDAQWMLNSGFFRELIMLYCNTSSITSALAATATATPAGALARGQLLQSLQMLSLQSMSLLGKYIWRVPDLSKLIHTEEYREKYVVDSLLWLLMGMELAGTSRLRMKNVPVLSQDSCRAGALACLERLCQQVAEALIMIGDLRRKAPQELSATMVDSSAAWKEPIQELERFTNCLVNIPAVAPLWKQVVTPDVLQTHLMSLRKALAELPALEITSQDKPSKGLDQNKSAENDKAGNPLERPTHTYEEEVAAIRKAVKVLSVSLQETHGGSRGMSSKAD